MTSGVKPVGTKAIELDTNIGYFQTNAHHMRYAHFRHLGMFVGYGTVEAGCKSIIGARMKQSRLLSLRDTEYGAVLVASDQAVMLYLEGLDVDIEDADAGLAHVLQRQLDESTGETERLYEQTVAFIQEGMRERAVTVPEEGGRPRRMPLAIPPAQQPHPPLWYGVHSPQAGDRAARRGMNVIGLDTVPELVPCFDNYRKAWRETRGDAPLPKMGIGRFVFVADTDAEALRVARRAYAKWHASFVYLSQLMGWKHRHPRPAEFDAIAADGRAVAGTPDTVFQYVRDQMCATGANYFVGQFAFGDLTQEETLRSIALFSEAVMPRLRH